MWLENAFWANNYTSYDDVVTQISLAGGYSTYSIGENIVQVKTAQGGFGGDKWINFISPDIFIPAFGILNLQILIYYLKDMNTCCKRLFQWNPFCHLEDIWEHLQIQAA